MTSRILILVDESVDSNTLLDCRELASSFATFLNEDLRLARVDEEALVAATTAAERSALDGLEVIAPKQPSAAAMSAAPFVFKEDGTPDWGAMWTSFCELALYGGPPHRGGEDALSVPEDERPANPEIDPIAEIRRGIWETTGLYSEPAEPGWLSVSCNSRRMAAWLCAAIILENVDARCEDECLYVPASPSFSLKNEVKSVVTVVAKTNHYWQAHVQEQQALAERAV